MTRSIHQIVPKYTAEIEEIKANGMTEELLQKIIQKHRSNMDYNEKLYYRYLAVEEGLPIFERQPKFEEENPINNKVNDDFFGEIVDFKVGYFAGKPIGYGYSKTDESEKVTGGKEAVEAATKAVTDFVTRNNMFGVDMEVTKNAAIYGYSGRLFYIDPEGEERVMAVHGYETIILSTTNIAEPEFAIRYFKETDIDGVENYVAEFYDNRNVSIYKGNDLSLEFVETKEHLFDYCPLQGVCNNSECMGDAEKVIALIDNYDVTMSDNSNEIEAFAHAYMVFRQNISDEEMKRAQKTGSFQVPAVGSGSEKEPIYFLTKNVNDGFTQNHLDRVEDNIYRFSKTPNLGDESWGNASGVSLKFKLHGLEVKCAQFQAQMMTAAQYMWKLLASAWGKKGIKVDPLQCLSSFERNFPMDTEANARTAQALKNAGVPDEIAWDIAIPEIDDIDYALEVKKQAQEDAMSLYENAERDQNKNANDDYADDDEQDEGKQQGENDQKTK